RHRDDGRRRKPTSDIPVQGVSMRAEVWFFSAATNSRWRRMGARRLAHPRWCARASAFISGCSIEIILTGRGDPAMLAAYYERNGAAADVLAIGEIETPRPGPGEVRVRLRMSGVNPSDVKSRAGTARKIAFPRVIPHSDGAGEIDAVGTGVAAA